MEPINDSKALYFPEINMLLVQAIKDNILKVICTVFLFLSVGLLNDASCMQRNDQLDIELNDLNLNLIKKYRLYPISVWRNSFLSYWPFTEDDKKKIYETKNSLHHLAGNAIHILKMYNSSRYFTKMREIEESRRIYADRSKEIIQGRNPANDLKEIINLLKHFEESEKDVNKITGLYEAIKRSENNLEDYRTQRKLTLYVEPDERYVGEDWSYGD